MKNAIDVYALFEDHFTAIISSQSFQNFVFTLSQNKFAFKNILFPFGFIFHLKNISLFNNKKAFNKTFLFNDFR